MEICHTAGLKGILEYIDAFKNIPAKIFFTVAVPLNLNKSADKFMPSVGELKKLLSRDDIVGVGEGYWQMILGGNRYLPELAEESLKLGKTVEGHSAGAHNDKLSAYLAYGVNSDHESTTIEDVLERLRMGVFIMIRQGSIRKELDTLAPMADMNIDFSNISIVTDGVDPRNLISEGYLEASAQNAIDLGFDFIKTIQMITINPARHFRLDHYIGGIAPAKYADILVLPEKEHIKPELVISGGKKVARNGKMLAELTPSEFSIKGLTEIKENIKSEDLKITSPDNKPHTVRVIDMVTELVAREALVEIKPENREIKPDISHDLLKVSSITPGNRIFNALVRGIGLKSGAIASSYIWETYGIIAIGTNDLDMIYAINRVISHTGGIALFNSGKLEVEVPLPTGGIITDMPIESLAASLNKMQQKSEEMGGNFKDIAKTISVLTTGAIPFLRINEDGLLDLKLNKIVPFIVS
jgi:adenine deaminase